MSTMFAIIMCVILQLQLAKGATLNFVGVQANPSTIQTTNTQLIIFGTLVNPIPAQGSIQINAPSEVSINSGSLTCQFVLPLSGITISSCIASSRKITIILGASIQAEAFEIHISNMMTNPLSTTPTSSFTFESYGTTGALIDQLLTGIDLIATEGILQTTQLTPTSLVVGATTTLEIRFKASHSIPAGSQIKVTFPKWNPLSTTTPQDYIQGGMSCSTKAVLQATLQCSFASSVLTVTGGVGTSIAGNTEVAFSVTNFRNPLSTTQVSGISILVVDSSGGNIDRGTATVKVSQSAAITNAAVTVDSSVSSTIAGIVQETNKLRLTFTRPVPLNQNCAIKVLLPSQFSVSLITSILVSGFGNSQTTYTPTKSSLDNSFSFTDCASYTPNTQSSVIIIDSLKLPNYNKPTGSFQITIKASNGDDIAVVTSGITFTAQPGSVQSVALVAQTPTILASTSITFTIVPKHTLDVTSRIQATFPSGYAMGSACTVTPSSSINAAASCTFSGQTVTVNNFLPTVYIGGSNSQIVFTLGLITLPQTTQALSGLTVSLLNQDSSDSQFYLVDTISTSVPITIGFGSMKSVVVTPASVVAFATTSYKFEITPEHYIPQNGYIVIAYPSDISIPDPIYSQSQCFEFSSTFTTTPTCVIDATARTIKINNGFRQTSYPPGGTTFSFKVPGIVNPVNLGDSGTFTAKTYTSTNQLMDQKLSGIIVTMTTTAFMKSVVVTLGSYINAATTSYTFLITPTVPVTESHLVVIQFPPEITLPTSESLLACTSTDTTIFNSATCTFNKALLSNSIKVALDLKSTLTQINILQTFRITVNGIKNPSSTKQTSDFLVKITDKSQNDINKSPSGITVSTNTPYTLKQSSLKQNNTGAGQPVQINITLYPENDILIGGGIYISYPSQVTTTTDIKATVISSYTKQTPSITITPSSRQILIRNAFQLKVSGTADDTILIVLTGFLNPRLNTASSSFVVKTFNEETVNSAVVQYYVDQVTDGLILNSPCDYPCATCTSSLASNCTSCYPTNTLNKLQGGTCVSECSLGKFFNSKTSVCESCSYPCLGCNVTSTNCTSCGYQDFLFLHQGKCLGTCPNAYVKNLQTNQCVKCNSECATCDLTPSTCTRCNKTTGFPYLYQSTCKTSCPINTTITRTDYCETCDPICKTCYGSPTFCTTCQSYRKFDPLLNTCSQACQENIQVYNASTGQCMNCDGNCLTCSGTTKTCTTCNNNLLLNTDNTCKSTCSGLDQTPISNICKQCELPCAQCKGSINHCTKCQADYLLFNTTCVQYCPEKYEPNNSTGQCILVGLICPEGFTVNEAGNGCIPNEFECPEGQMINAKRTACVPAPGSPVPFPFLIFSLILCLLVLGSYIKDKYFTKVYSNLIALLSFQEMLIYLIMMAYAGANAIWGAFVLSLIAIIMLMTANIMFYLYYKKEILQDEIFVKWQRSFPKTSKYIPMIALFVNFKCIRLFYSGFYGLESSLAQFENPMKNFFRPLRMLTYFNYIFVYIPVIVADFIIFAQVKWGYQLLILGIETFLLTIAIVVLTYFEFRDPKKLIMQGDEAYSRIKPRHFNGESMVMGGMVDVDESTLIRTKVIDDEYEIFLRKKAFVSILNQVGKNFFTAQEKGLDLGGKIDQVMTKFDENKLKLRRAFSLEHIKEEDWYIPSEQNHDDTQEFLTKKHDVEVEEDDTFAPRRYSYPLSPKSKVTAPDPLFRTNLKEIKEATKEQLDNNVYAECKAPDKNKEKNRRKTVSRRTQTYLRELLQIEGDDLHESDLEIIMEDEAEIDMDYTKDLIDNVIDGISESESNLASKKRVKKKRKNVTNKRKNEIPDFELADIMGDFEIDDLGNFIILRGEKGELLDKKERRVNRRGYLIDRFGNIINKMGQVIFKAVELDSDDEIPAPFGFEKRKKNLLNLGQDGEFKIQGNDKEIEDDEDLIDRELRMMKKQNKKKKILPDGQIVEEEGDNEDGESSVDSLMAESPGKYQLDQNGENEDDIIANVTKKKIPVRRGQKSSQNKRISPNRTGELSPQESQKRTGPLQNLPPKRIKREDTKDMFPQLAVEASQQKKLFKIAEQIGGMASQMAETQKKNQSQDFETLSNQQQNQERLERLKQEHFKDIIGESQLKQSKLAGHAATTDKKQIPPKPTYDKIYGNLGDVVNYEEQLLKEQYKGARAQSPFSSQMTSRMGFRPEASTIGGDKRKIRGLESIYLQKFDKKAGLPGSKRPPKAKFRNTLQQFVDDPELLLDDGIDRVRENEMSLKVADKLDRLQKQYMSNTATNNFKNFQSASNMAIQPTVGAAIMRKNGSLSGSLFNHDPSLEPIKKGNWVDRD